MGPVSYQTLYTERVLISVTSYRRRLLDPDNILAVPKYFIDFLRHVRVLRDDRCQDVEVRVAQQKVATENEERTEIEVTPLP